MNKRQDLACGIVVGVLFVAMMAAFVAYLVSLPGCAA